MSITPLLVTNSQPLLATSVICLETASASVGIQSRSGDIMTALYSHLIGSATINHRQHIRLVDECVHLPVQHHVAGLEAGIDDGVADANVHLLPRPAVKGM